MKHLLFNKSKLALITVMLLLLCSVTVYANPMDTAVGTTSSSEGEILFTGKSAIGMGGNTAGTELKLILEADSRFRLETTKPRGSGNYTITEENGLNKIVFVYDDAVDNKPLEMAGTISTSELTDAEIVIKIENVLYNITGMGVMKMGEVEFNKAPEAPTIPAIVNNIVYKGKAAFGMQPGTFTAMTVTIMPDKRFMVETTKPRGEGSYEITANADGINTIIFTYDDKDSEGNILTMNGTVSDADLSKSNVAIEIKNATYPLKGMKPLKLGYLKLMVPNDSPSAMYVASVEEAIKAGLVPESMQNSYNLSLTRQEACELIVSMMEAKEGKSIDEILAAKKLAVSDKKFEDCTSKAVYVLEAMKIINGVSSTKFEPHKLVTKEALAVILSNTLKNYFGYSSETGELKAMDAAKISNWAKQAVATVLDLKINDNTLMSTEKGLFSPTSHISREQSYLIILHLASFK